eukprot:CAMPEP_0176277662 /NCGR_PEP_ID=MMETSP0121_2-20121125/48393_1 /TAXON_ID=160619 /ORGANISM="Kryptoperidinium foliaceum, Strain CCMP 1326" /LENGTH=48 /DNA_ID= /DNA_START= /DNA_END= /DNA_ORIENTATION=
MRRCEPSREGEGPDDQEEYLQHLQAAYQDLVAGDRAVLRDEVAVLPLE